VFGITFGWDDEVPSIAIIPFDNKGDKQDEFYAYSISSELISDIAGAGLIRVAGLKDIESLEYQTLKYDELSEKLLVRYIAHGSIWKVDSVFQLSMELYDTKTSKVLWSESWQKGWNELASIKGNLADNILKSLKVSTRQDIAKSPTYNTEAYEYYLKGKYKYEKRENMEDTEITRGLLRKAIELDNNLLRAKNLLATTYYVIGDYDKAMEIYLENLKKAEKIGDKDIQARSLNNIGILCEENADHDKALDYYDRSLKIVEELGDKKGISLTLCNIGNVYLEKGDYDTASDYFERSLKIDEEIGYQRGMGFSLAGRGSMYYNKGDYEKALDYYERALKIYEELGHKKDISHSTLMTKLLIYLKRPFVVV
jgi:tetratricopeptide (TPR) repeat protein